MVGSAAPWDHGRITTPTTEHGRRGSEPARRGSPRALTRASDGRVLGGVCAGLARWFGVDPLVPRIAFVVLALGGGFGVVAYFGLWLALPDDKGRRGAEAVLGPSGRDRSQRALAMLLVSVGLLLLAREMGFWVGDKFVWPVVLAAVGLALAWPETGGLRLPGKSDPSILSSRAALVRVGAGIVSVVAGALYFALANADLQALGNALMAVALSVAGIFLIFGPWWFRLGRDLIEERRARIRSEERAEVAARVHDSVLQTLALIQQQAVDAPEIVSLARRQERELRALLFGGPGANDGTLKSSMAAAAADVEDTYSIAVDVVTVGDCPREDALDALTAAAKEAMVNAAKFAGTPSVSLYVEVEGDQATVFVRDRGAGFEPAAVPPDRQGIAESIRGRMERHGGHARIRSAPGEGTEVELTMPRRAG